MNDIICIHTVYNPTEADLIKASLESAGISCFLRSDNADGVLPHLTQASGIGIMVLQEDEKEAMTIIREGFTD